MFNASLAAAALAVGGATSAPPANAFDRPFAIYVLGGLPSAVGHAGLNLEVAPSRYFALEAACGVAFGVLMPSAANEEAQAQGALKARGRAPIRDWMAVTFDAGYAVGAESTVSEHCLVPNDSCRYSQAWARWDTAHRVVLEGGFEMRMRTAEALAIRFFIGWAQTVNAPTACFGPSTTCRDAPTGWPLIGVALGAAFPVKD